MPDTRFDTYYMYDDLTKLLQGYATEYPKLAQLGSLGKSYEGRDIWLMTLTNSETGPAEEKPALWVDANIHASEVSPTIAALHLIHKLTTEYGSSDEVTRVLDTRVFYIVPRLNPDGAEKYLREGEPMLRSSVRPYPYDEEPFEGLRIKDVDGDGRVLSMRIQDPNGEWKAYDDDPRLMVRRDPTEEGGTYYRILFEGEIDNYDGVTITPQRLKEGLDLNRNFPSNWRHEAEQRGAGPFPLSEPETYNAVQFIAQHPNITGGITFHTWSGVILRPYGTKPDDEFPAEDLDVYKKIGAKATEVTGYPVLSVFHDFKYHPKEVITGVFDDWLYDQFGRFGWTVEIWSPQKQAGIEKFEKPIDWYRDHPVEDDLKMLQWSDEVLEGKGYIDWYAFEHPQLGQVELGGWDYLYCWRNPPPQLLEEEISRFADWVIWHLLISPRLERFDLSVNKLAEDQYHVQFSVHNTGWLPTYVTKKAMQLKTLRGVVFEIDLPDGASLISGKQREVSGQLEGRAYTASSATPWTVSLSTDDRSKVEWVVSAPAGTSIQLTAHHERAGIVREQVTLE
ncbi:MAG: carboxypeptidase [Chloroflexi bacterium]|nr:carboxypeptidase [Chloroflexota bacterium]